MSQPESHITSAMLARHLRDIGHGMHHKFGAQRKAYYFGWGTWQGQIFELPTRTAFLPYDSCHNGRLGDPALQSPVISKTLEWPANAPGLDVVGAESPCLTALFFSLRFSDYTETGRVQREPMKSGGSA